MKRLFALLLVLVLSFTLIACGGDNATDTDADTSKETENSDVGEGNETENKGNDENDEKHEDKYVFVSGDVTVIMNAAADSILSALGEPNSTYESPSCAFQGNDYYYDYGSFELSAYDEGEGQFIYSVFFKDDLIETPEGLCIGDSASEVESLYGAEGKLDSGNYSYTDGNCNLMIFITDGAVSSIEYTAVVQ